MSGARRGIVADLARGAAAGAAALWLRDQLDWFMFEHESADSRRRTLAARPHGRDPAHLMAERAAEAMGTQLWPRQPNPAGLAVHYGVAAGMGALYGALQPRLRPVGAGHGVLFGLAMFALQDEGLNTWLGTAGPPRLYPWQAHARGAVSHALFGFATDALTRLGRR